MRQCTLPLNAVILAIWPATLCAEAFAPSDEQRQWWSFQPIAEVEPPDVIDESRSLTDIDRFVRAKLQRHNLSPAPQADKRTLLRRAKYALVGLPPTSNEIDSFLKDHSPRAFTRVVNRWLASPHYGEHWGRHWLDVVRYTDYLSPQADDVDEPENGGVEFFEAFRYRDWVVSAINRDMPFDDFIVHQIAGDHLASETGGEFYADGLIATTVLSIGVWDNGDADKQKIVSDIVDDQINLVGKAFLGITLACARCHDHKYDPISTEDYYGLAGIFYSTRILEALGKVGLHTEAMRVPLATADYVSQRKIQLAQIESIKKQIGNDGARTAGDEIDAIEKENNNGLSVDDKTKLKNELDKLQNELLPAPATVMAALDGGTPRGLFPEIGDIPIHIMGRYDNLGPKIPRRMPVFFRGTDQTPITAGSGRLELARWIASDDNPLTARVIVNRVWQQLFGQGLVRTSNNFGLLGDQPTHPRLLDWLARRFIDDGWSNKQLIRSIMNSRTYQQASLNAEYGVGRVERTETPNSELRAFHLPRRLRAEEIRDSMLAITGQLDPKLGGRATKDLNRPRRSLYIQTVRADRRNFSTLFDAADPEECVGTRNVSTIAPQALFFLNDKFVHEQAEQLAKRIAREVPDDDRARIRRAYILLYGREADEEEVLVGLDLIARASKRHPESAWNEYAHVLFCANEFCYLD